MPYVTEELYKSLGERNGQNLISGRWPDYSSLAPSQEAKDDLSWVLNIISEIRSVRSDMNVPAGAKIALQFKDADETTQRRFNTYEEAILRLARLESITEVSEIQKGALQTVVGKTTLILPIAELIDLDKERERLQKEIGKLDADIKKISQKLDNKKFVENAPTEVVEEQKNRREEALSVKEKLDNALKQLEAA